MADTKVFCDGTFIRYHTLEFSEELMKCVNPYVLIDEVKTMTGYLPKRVIGSNKR